MGNCGFCVGFFLEKAGDFVVEAVLFLLQLLELTDALASFGRDGVPLYVFYPTGAASPQILPQVPTQGALREAFAATAASPGIETLEEKNES